MRKPEFPTIMFIAAVFKDLVLDPLVLVSTILLVPLGWVLGICVALIYGGIFGLWFLANPSEWKRRRALRFFVKVLIVILIGFIPLLRFIFPEATLLVWLDYRERKKNWKKSQGKKSAKREIVPRQLRYA